MTPEFRFLKITSVGDGEEAKEKELQQEQKNDQVGEDLLE